MYVRLFYSYFLLGRYAEANKWISKILNKNEKGFTPNIISLAKIMHLILFIEMKKFDILPYALKSTYRYFCKSGKLYQFENIVLSFIRNLVKVQTREELIQSYQIFKADLELIKQNPFENKILYEFDLIGWLNNKIDQEKQK